MRFTRRPGCVLVWLCLPLAGVLGAAALVGCSSSAHSVPPSSEPASTAPSSAEPLAGGARLMTRAIPGGSSRFAARPAEVYLPPILAQHPTMRLPVLELLHGAEGKPSDWITHGAAATALDSFAAAHQGRAPIVVMPDINGSTSTDSECIRTPRGGDVEEYLAEVVPAWISRHLPATTDHRDWGVAGASEGGTCAAMLALRYPHRFTSFGDLLGLAHLTLGDTNHRALTTRALFGGSSVAYDRHDPLWLLAHGGRRSSMGAWFECGAQDAQVVRDQGVVAAAARAAGVATRATTVPGRHTWSVLKTAFAQMLPWFYRRST